MRHFKRMWKLKIAIKSFESVVNRWDFIDFDCCCGFKTFFLEFLRIKYFEFLLFLELENSLSNWIFLLLINLSWEFNFRKALHWIINLLFALKINYFFLKKSFNQSNQFVKNFQVFPLKLKLKNSFKVFDSQLSC